MRSKLKVAILGAGPSASFALAACKEIGASATVYSNRPGFTPNGRVWYREVPPLIKALIQPEPVLVFGVGTREVYLERQDRPSWANTTFPVDKPLIHVAYNPIKVRDLLMPVDFPFVKIDNITDDLVADIAREHHWVFQTFPTVKSKSVEPPLRTYHVLTRTEPMENESWPNVMIYNGTRHHWWTRWSCLYGVTCWEFSSHEYPEEAFMPPPPNGTKYEKSKDFAPNTFVWDPHDVPAPNVILLGRWATWDKRYFTHMAYHEAMEVLKKEI